MARSTVDGPRRGLGGLARRANPTFAAGAVAIPLVALAAALNVTDPRVLLYVHVMAGVLWSGIDVFMGAVLGPVVGGLEPRQRAAFFAKFTPKMTFLLPTLATVTIAGGIVLTTRLKSVAHFEPWLALLTAATTIPVVLLIAAQFDAFGDPRTWVALAAAVLGSGAFLWGTLPEFGMTSPWIIAALAIVTLLSNIGFGVILPGEVRIYRQITSEDPDLDVVSDIGMRNAKLGGVQGALQLAIIAVMVGLRFVS